MPETGVTDQARAMLDRVSPEGRARALKAQRRRQAQTNKLILRSLLAGVIVAVLTAPVDERILFSTPLEQRWEAAAALVGVDIASLTDYAGHA